MSSETRQEPLGPYLAQFAIVYTLLSLAAAAVLYALNIEANAGVGVATTMASALYAAQRFFAATGRLMNAPERRTAILASLAISLTLSVILALAFLSALAGSLPKGLALVAHFSAALPPGIWGVVLLAAVAIQGAVLWFAYGYMARMILKKSVP